jgi:hypothetical protein
MSLSESFKNLIAPWLKANKRIPNELKSTVEYWRPWRNTTHNETNRVVYITGDSWMWSPYFNDYLLETWPNDMFINRYKKGNSNHEILEILQQDIAILEQISQPKIIIVAFSEIGRHTNEIDASQIHKHHTVNEYLKSVQQQQFEQVMEISGHLSNTEIFATSAFVPNMVNSNPTVTDFLDHTPMPAPCFNLTSSFYASLVEAGHVTPENCLKDLDMMDQYVTWLTSHSCCNETGHLWGIEGDKVYQRFFHHYLS